MVKKGEVGLAKLLNIFQSQQWLFFKVKMLERVLNNMDVWFPEIKKGDEDSITREMLNLEIFITTLHYSEVLAANLLAMRKRQKRYHRTLLDYKSSEIFDFYTKIEYKPISYIAKLLGYPPLSRVSGNEEHRLALKKSCILVKKNLVEIGHLYVDYNGLFNAYKHGFRLALFESDDPETEKLYPAIMWPLKGEKGAKADKATIMSLGNCDREIELCAFMCQVLDAVTETFKLRVLENKQEFKVVAFSENTDNKKLEK